MLTIAEMKQQHEAAGYRFFDEWAMNFYNREIETQKLTMVHEDKGLFISSECREDDEVRRYTIRLFDFASRDVHEIGEFRGYETLEDAQVALKELLKTHRSI
ncbi:DUF7447 family protein [Shouchella lonarensis]|uniref:Uncharacterized protein n=1 Tax=Shouchella lonarensis TaxID=1464122 RepID=A0A1G6HM48_9BACI|nr:hypothetical protein [Shouchella lonarensis]SDB95301.1 hypothetical protein SAMN05421737_10472 [Shouchella lonarensis]